jgi:hypothetical protein
VDKPSRRTLRFDDLDDVVREAESLRASGYHRAGAWDLAQVCTHLAEWMRFPLDGFPRPPAPIRAMLWVMKNTFGRRQLRKVLATSSMPAGGPTMPETVAAAGGDETAAVERLRQTVARFKAHTGPLHPSPLFGPLDKEAATRLQLVHCAHHLSFLVPRPGDEGRPR